MEIAEDKYIRVLVLLILLLLAYLHLCVKFLCFASNTLQEERPDGGRRRQRQGQAVHPHL
jgi:hypothetical protein